MMFGSYPHPGNIIENNTIEFINVYVKPGKPPKFGGACEGGEQGSREPNGSISRSRSGSCIRRM